MSNTTARGDRVRAILRIFGCIALICAAVALTAYSLMNLVFGLQLRDNLESAKSDCTAISVEIEQISRADNSRYWYAVRLKPAEALPASSSAPPGHANSTIYATTLNPDLVQGQVLTAYYNETTREVELVDFALAEPMMRAAVIGFMLDGLIVAVLIVRLVLYLRRRKRQNAPLDTEMYT